MDSDPDKTKNLTEKMNGLNSQLTNLLIHSETRKVTIIISIG